MHARIAILALSLLSCSAIAQANNGPGQRVDLRARVSGYVVKVQFKAGDAVKKGQLLFELDDRVFRALVEQAEAQVLAWDARVKSNQAQVTRADVLLKQGVISREEFEKLRADLAVSQAERQAAAAGRTLALLNLDFTKIRAPIDGKIGKALCTEGNLAKADDTSLAIIESQNAK